MNKYKMNVLTAKGKLPAKVYIIRKKHIVQNYTYWTKPEIEQDTYFSNILEEKHYVYSFLNPNAVHRCYAFLKKFKEIKGTYPDLYDGLTFNKEKEGDIYIETDTLYALKYRCLLNNIGLMGLTTFDYTYCETFLGKKDVFNLTISGIDLLEDEKLDYPTQIDHLNYLLDF